MSWDNFHKYIGVHGILALILTSAMIAWISFSMAVPAEAWALLGASWGFYFAKNGGNVAKATANAVNPNGK